MKKCLYLIVGLFVLQVGSILQAASVQEMAQTEVQKIATEHLLQSDANASPRSLVRKGVIAKHSPLYGQGRRPVEAVSAQEMEYTPSVAEIAAAYLRERAALEQSAANASSSSLVDASKGVIAKPEPLSMNIEHTMRIEYKPNPPSMNGKRTVSCFVYAADGRIYEADLLH